MYRDIWSFKYPLLPPLHWNPKFKSFLRFLSRNSCHALPNSFVARPARGEKWNPSRGIRRWRRRRRWSVDKTVAGAENQDHFSILLLRSIHNGRQLIIMQGIRRGGKGRAILPNLSEFAGEQPFFQEWNKLLKKVCPSKLGTLKMDKPFQCLFIECILPSFLGNNFHSSCSLSLAIEAPPARDRWMGGSISSGEEEQQTLSLFPPPFLHGMHT